MSIHLLLLLVAFNVHQMNTCNKISLSNWCDFHFSSRGDFGLLIAFYLWFKAWWPGQQLRKWFRVFLRKVKMLHPYRQWYHGDFYLFTQIPVHMYTLMGADECWGARSTALHLSSCLPCLVVCLVVFSISRHRVFSHALFNVHYCGQRKGAKKGK